MTKPLAGKVALITGTGRRCQKYPAPVQLQTLRYNLQHVLGDFIDALRREIETAVLQCHQIWVAVN